MTLTETHDVASGKVNGEVHSKRIWGCLLTNIGYLRGVLTLYYSLIRSGTKYPFYVIYTEVTNYLRVPLIIDFRGKGVRDIGGTEDTHFAYSEITAVNVVLGNRIAIP